MMLAAVGNNNAFTCDEGPLLPAGWEAISRPGPNECSAEGLVGTMGQWAHPRPPPPPRRRTMTHLSVAPLYRPRVVAALRACSVSTPDEPCSPLRCALSPAMPIVVLFSVATGLERIAAEEIRWRSGGSIAVHHSIPGGVVCSVPCHLVRLRGDYELTHSRT